MAPAFADGDRVGVHDEEGVRTGTVVEKRDGERWSVRDRRGKETGTVVRMPSGRYAVRDEEGRTTGYLRCLRCRD